MSKQSRQLAMPQHFTFPADDFPFLHHLSSVPGPYPLMMSNEVESPKRFITYVDTMDYRLLRCGFAAWIEQTNSGLQLGIENLATNLSGKVDKQIQRRVNLAEPIDNDKVAMKLKAWPRTLRKAVAAALAGRVKLHPLVMYQHNQEQGMMVAPPSADTKQNEASILLAEITMDRYTVCSPSDQDHCFTVPSADHPVATLGRLSIAFDANATTEQEKITAWLTSQPGLQPTSQSLIDQALTASMLHKPGEAGLGDGLQPQMLIADACRVTWRAQLLEMLFTEAGVRYSRSPKYVHEMRVLIRRMRSMAKLYGHFFPRKTLRPYLATLRHTAQMLGNVRNLDVAIANARLQGTDDEQGIQAPKKLLKEWRTQRQAAHETLIQWLDSGDYSKFLTSFQQFCATVESSDKCHTPGHTSNKQVALAPQQLRHVVPTQILAGYAAVRCYEAVFETNAVVDMTTLHELRLACKSLRYNLEFAQPLLGPEGATLIDRLKALQELLGDLNDTVTARSLIASAGKNVDASDYLQLQAARATDLIARVPAALTALVDQDSREQLGKALARL